MLVSAASTLDAQQAKADKQMQRVLDAHAALHPKPIETLTPAEARMQPTPADAVKKVLEAQHKSTDPLKLVPGVSTTDKMIPGAAGQLPATVYTPAGKGPFPVVVYFHGGGWVIANRMVYDGGARGLSKAANAVVISTDYRLAPEAKFPAQHDDALAVYRYVTSHASEFNGDGKNFALAGESAGGNLAVATAVAARDAKLPMAKAIVAVYPVAQTDTMTPSYIENANAKPLNRPMIGWFVKHLIKSPADLMDTRLSLIKADLKGLPPVTLINAQIDPLRSDSDLLEKALKAAGVKVEHKNWNGVTHEFFGMAAVVDKAKEAQKWAGTRLKQAFAK